MGSGNHWSYGLGGGSFEHVADHPQESRDLGAFPAHYANDSNRPRLAARHFDDPVEDGRSSCGLHAAMDHESRLA